MEAKPSETSIGMEKNNTANPEFIQAKYCSNEVK